MSNLEDAKLLIQAISKALADGTRHYNKKGKLLTSTKEILETLVSEGSVTLDPSPTVTSRQSSVQ